MEWNLFLLFGYFPPSTLILHCFSSFLGGLYLWHTVIFLDFFTWHSSYRNHISLTGVSTHVISQSCSPFTYDYFQIIMSLLHIFCLYHFKYKHSTCLYIEIDQRKRNHNNATISDSMSKSNVDKIASIVKLKTKKEKRKKQTKMKQTNKIELSLRGKVFIWDLRFSIQEAQTHSVRNPNHSPITEWKQGVLE